MSEVKGRARLLIDHQIMDQSPIKIEMPKYGQISWNLMEVKELFDLFKSFLLLPEQYEIIGVYFDTTRYVWSLLLEGEDIPLPERGMELPLAVSTYYVENGKVSIHELKFI
jgi:hypothetical protein